MNQFSKTFPIGSEVYEIYIESQGFPLALNMKLINNYFYIVKICILSNHKKIFLKNPCQSASISACNMLIEFLVYIVIMLVFRLVFDISEIWKS
jgi:hypothetical protein